MSERKTAAERAASDGADAVAIWRNYQDHTGGWWDCECGDCLIDRDVHVLEAFERNACDAIHYACVVLAERDALARLGLEWRCFHCDEVFTDEAEAQAHFGADRLMSKPACLIDAAAFRAMEATVLRFHEEDTDLHREIASLRSDLSTATRRAEEGGYARGLADAKKHPEELGLMVAPLPTPGAAPADVCEWTEDDDGVWQSACGIEWCSENEAHPSRHGMRFCHGCGKRLRAATPAPPATEAP
ncbi:MAG: hypothetical protein AB7R67_20060 [Vicinamibacterales bacterium]